MTGTRTIYLDGRPVPAGAGGMRLLDWLRDCAGRTAPKEGCAAGHCGACTVLIDGRPVLSCCTLVIAAAGRRVWTAEGLARTRIGGVLRQKLTEHGAIQCGFCAPGMLAAGVAWLADRDTHNPGRSGAAAALSGNLCRCTGYSQMLDALVDAADFLKR
jgi:aerobic-type carbon monoxide dehydrogenase small subunit (CoxS/CutS family)